MVTGRSYASKLVIIVLSSADVISWVVCDGDIDPEWIEALNSVLDDNRLLTMASGERIKFGPDVNFIFDHGLVSFKNCLSKNDVFKALVHTVAEKNAKNCFLGQFKIIFSAKFLFSSLFIESERRKKEEFPRGNARSKEEL